VNTDWGKRLQAEGDIPEDRVVTYDSVLENGLPHIRYRLLYLNLVRRGGPVSGMNYLGSPFKWRYPELSVKVVNNSGQNMLLSQAVVTIVSSKIEMQPILLVEDMSVNELVIRNEGWTEVVNPMLEFSIAEERPNNEVPLFAEERNTLNLQTFDAVRKVSLLPYLPGRLQNESLVAVFGNITYGGPESRKTLQFHTRVSLQVRAAAPMPPSYCYEAYFEAGVAPAIHQIPLAQQIRPGEADNFLIRLGTNKTSQNRVQIEFLTAGGERLRGPEFEIDLFVPRTTGQINRCGE